MILKLKAIIYRYFGVYLAQSELDEYLKSDKFKKECIKNNEAYEYSLSDSKRLAVGNWDFEHGFYRPYVKFNRYKRTDKIRAFVASFLIALKHDLDILYRKLKNNK